MSLLTKIPLLVVLSLLAACGEVITNTTPPPSPPPVGSGDISTDLNHPQGNTAVVLGANYTDPIGTLSLLSIDKPRTATKNLQTTHSDAVVKSFQNTLYVVNRLGADNIEVIDPSLNFRVTKQFSVGQGTNPQDIIVTSPTKAYLTLYQPEDNRSEDLTVDDLVIVNPSTGEILKTIDLTPFTASDGERLARASSMVIVDNKIFVAIQDLPGDLSLPPDQPGKIIVIDTATDRIIGALVLDGRDPIAMNYSEETGLIYIADASFFDLNTSFGGVEAMDPELIQTRGIVIDDLELGGTPGEIEVSGTSGYTILSSLDPEQGSRLVRFGLGDDPVVTTVYQGRSYIQEVALDENGLLLVGDRDPTVNGILFIDPETNQVIDGPINTGAAPSSITFIER